MKEFKYNLVNLIHSKELYLAFIGILIVNLVHVIMVIHYNYNSDLFYETGYKSEYLFILYNAFVNLNVVIIIIFPIISSTVYSDASWKENNQKMFNMLHFRLNKRKHIIARAITILLAIFLINFLAFFLNYISLFFIYGSGNAITYYQSPPFYLITNNTMFLDLLRNNNVMLFALAISAHVAFIISLLSLLTYSISFYVKQKIIIHIFPFIFIAITEFLLSKTGFDQFSIINLLQPLSGFEIKNAIFACVCLIAISLLLIIIHINKRDKL